jgi:hypothetical protein
MLSHVDGDHITGLLDYLADLEADNYGLPDVGAMWFNSFGETVGTEDVEETLKSLSPRVMGVMSDTANAVAGIDSGDSLRRRALQVAIPLNPGFQAGLVCVDDAPAPVQLANLTLTVVGPTRANLATLQQEWEDWVEKQRDAIEREDLKILANSDQSVPNLSSIICLAQAEGRSILFTGDGRSDHLLDGLEAAGLLDDDGTMHVDVFKVPHHGSNRNATKTFFRKVTADRYVISAHYHPDNPDLSTMIWIVEAAQRQQREIEIWATNRTNTIDKLLEEYPEDDYGYTLRLMPPHFHYWDMPLSD